MDQVIRLVPVQDLFLNHLLLVYRKSEQIAS
jgi:hypothetical protein